MLTLNELKSGTAKLLKDLRLKKGYSKFKMASIVSTSDHTWARYESGESAPTVPEFINIYNSLSESALNDVLSLIYPEAYASVTAESICDKRKEIMHFFESIAPNRTISEIDFLLLGNHGSNVAPQLEMFTMIEHLPMKYRYAIAEHINVLWTIAEANDELIHTDEIMPDVELFREGLLKAKQATKDGMNSYTTATGAE